MSWTKKFVMWVEEIDDENEVLHVVGHEIEPADNRDGIKHSSEFDYAWLEIMLGEHGFNEIKQLGRLFYFYEGDKNRIDLPFFAPLTKEEQDRITKRAEEWAENLKEE